MKVLSYLSVLLSFKQNPSVGTGLFLPLKFGQFQQKTTKIGHYWGNEPTLPGERQVFTPLHQDFIVKEDAAN